MDTLLSQFMDNATLHEFVHVDNTPEQLLPRGDVWVFLKHGVTSGLQHLRAHYHPGNGAGWMWEPRPIEVVTRTGSTVSMG
jgi:hypothetical protein